MIFLVHNWLTYIYWQRFSMLGMRWTITCFVHIAMYLEFYVAGGGDLITYLLWCILMFEIQYFKVLIILFIFASSFCETPNKTTYFPQNHMEHQKNKNKKSKLFECHNNLNVWKSWHARNCAIHMIRWEGWWNCFEILVMMISLELV